MQILSGMREFFAQSAQARVPTLTNSVAKKKAEKEKVQADVQENQAKEMTVRRKQDATIEAHAAAENNRSNGVDAKRQAVQEVVDANLYALALARAALDAAIAATQAADDEKAIAQSDLAALDLSFAAANVAKNQAQAAYDAAIAEGEDGAALLGPLLDATDLLEAVTTARELQREEVLRTTAEVQSAITIEEIRRLDVEIAQGAVDGGLAVLAAVETDTTRQVLESANNKVLVQEMLTRQQRNNLFFASFALQQSEKALANAVVQAGTA